MWRTLRRSAQLDAAMHEEMRMHIEMEADRLVRERGLDREEAFRQAHVNFGGIEKYKEYGREARGLAWIEGLRLDGRLAIRMLSKHRGLTLIGSFAMAVAIAIGATSFEIITELLDPALPLPGGRRIVAIQYATENPGSPERRVTHEFTAWRHQVTSIEHLSAFRTAQHTLMSSSAAPEPVRVAEMTASGFDVAGTPPLLGRYLLPADEGRDAPSVLVLGYDAWQARFGGDPAIVGQLVTLAGTPHTIVGVMPASFRFPVDHQFWRPLRANPLDYERLSGPQLYMFGRLAPGMTREQAQAELSTLGRRLALAYPKTHARLRPLVLPFTREHLDLSQPALVLLLRIAQLLIGALTFVVAINLAILVYARTVTRLGEIAIRTALGASRARILAQLFIEAFALSILGAAAGLMMSAIALERIQALVPANGSVPFWLDFDLSLSTVAYSIGLAALAAVIIGVLPGLKSTARDIIIDLHELNGRSGKRLGSSWTTLVVGQVAVAVAVLPVAAYLSWRVVRMEVTGPGFPAEQFVVSTVVFGKDDAAVAPGVVRARQLDLMSRLSAEPGVSAVTFASAVPGFGPGGRRIQFEPNSEDSNLEVSTLDVDPDIFEALGAQVLAGRRFTAGDLGAAHAVIVNRTFAHRLAGGRSPLGLRFRYASTRSQTRAAQEIRHQIVGVVEDVPSFPPSLSVDGEPVVYHPAAVGDIDPVVIAVRFSGPVPAGIAERFREIGAAVDPVLQLRRIVPLSDFYDDVRSLWRYLAWCLALVTASVLLLSAAGIYAMMSFTVAQGTREIGIRAALGAHPHRLLFNIFGRALRQLSAGVAAGAMLSFPAIVSAGLRMSEAAMLLVAVAIVMVIVGGFAAIGPALRSLRVDVTDALRADG
jgi:predicted permease